MPVSSIAKGNEGHRDGELMHEIDSKDMDVIEDATPDATVNCFRTVTSDTYQIIGAMNDTTDVRVITPSEVKSIINEYDNVNETQRNRLMAVLIKY